MWQPISSSELEAVVERQLFDCSVSQRNAFNQYRVPFYRISIHRLGITEAVFVVAHLPKGMLYFEDVEEGFEIGLAGDDGALVSVSSNQYELHHILAQEGF